MTSVYRSPTGSGLSPSVKVAKGVRKPNSETKSTASISGDVLSLSELLDGDLALCPAMSRCKRAESQP